MNNILRVLIVFLFMQPAVLMAEAKTVTASLVLYTEQEPGTDSYPVRILVTAEYVRFDDGYNDSDYVLYERLNQRLSSVVHENKTLTVLTVPKQATLPSVESPVIDKLIEDDLQAPKIEELPVKLLTVSADGKACMTAAVVPGLLPDVVEALAEYHAVIKKRNMQGLATLPADLRTPCYLANQVFAYGSQYDFGFPVHENIQNGRKRVLMDYRSQEVKAKLFWLPKDYRMFQID